MSLKRFGVSLEDNLLESLDKFVTDNGFANRSQAIRHLVENRIVDKKWKENDVVSGAIVLLFDHHKGDVGVRMNEIQHQFYKEILSAQHFHLDHDNCLEIIAVKGNAYRLTDLANQLIGLKGIIHGNLVTSKMI